MFRYLLAAFAVAMVGVPTAARDDKDAKYVKLVQVSSGKVLAIADDSDEAGARAVVAKDDDKSQAQQWKVDLDNGYLKLTNRTSGKVLDVFENSTDEGTQIIQWDDKVTDNDNQLWNWAGTGPDRRLKSKNSGLVLDTTGEGQVVQKKPDDKAKTQLWKVQEVKK
jgi:hypothetical protein